MTKPPPDFLARAAATIRKAMVMKRNMLKKNLRVAKAKCPYCEGHWYARLAGNKNHMHMRCDGVCGTNIME